MQERLNVFLLTDVEGISGIDSIDVMDREAPVYESTRLRLCEEINLAVTAALEAGATRVYYLDGHAGGGNVIEERIHPAAIKCSLADWQRLLREGEIDCMIELGAHARAGTVGGFLDHTLSSKSIFSITVNGVEMSEFSLHAILCSQHGGPTVAVTGDETACAQAREYIPEIYTGAVKVASCRNRATTYENADEIIASTVKKALADYRSVPLYRPDFPLCITQVFYRTDMCEEALEKCTSEVERVDARTLRKTVHILESYSDLKF